MKWIVAVIGMSLFATVGHCEKERENGWVVQFGTAQNDSCMGVSVHRRSVYAFGRTAGALPGESSAGGQDVFLRKYDDDGTLVWSRQFGTTLLDDSFWGNVEAAHGRVIVAGGVTGALPGQTSAGGLDAFVRAYDTDGTVLWTRQFGTSAHDTVRNVALDRRGNIYLAAQTDGALPGQTHAGDRDAVVGKLDSDGNFVWLVQFGSSAFEEAIGVTIHGNDVYATGVTRGTLPGKASAGETDSFVIKLDRDDGTVDWLSQFGSSGTDSAWKIRVIGDAIFASGHTTGSWGDTNLGELDPFLVRLDMDGAVEWVRQFGTTGNDTCFSMTKFAGGIAMAGTVRGALPGQTPAGDGDFFVRAYDSDGVERWTLQWGTSFLDALAAIAVKGKDVYVSGASTASLGEHTNQGLQDAVVIRIASDAIDEEDDDEDEDDD
jgi:hypothetical protein